MLKHLQDLGLSEKEAAVYMAALEIGRATADQLAKHAKIKRPTTYVQLESLMKMGLMSTYEEDKRTYFAPESPELLKRLLTKQRDELEAKERNLAGILPGLTQFFAGAGERPAVRFFEGKNGIKAIRDGLLSLPSGTHLKWIYNHDSLTQVFDEGERYDFAKRRAAQGIQLQSIYTRLAGPFDSNDIVPNTERRFIEHGKMPITSDFYIYDNTVAMMALQERTFGILVESKEIAQSMGILFHLLWGIGESDQKEKGDS
ncbi:MAG: helix-turn-helix domain-containing protein [Candidatus Pacebacteria bacterium]|nr:helix-turn-helix domain-containing protein [Candidatus Paceibacterota bacterium]